MKALVGSWDNRPHQLLAEVTALRGRVRELESALDEAQRENERLRRVLVEADVEPALEREVALTSG